MTYLSGKADQKRKKIKYAIFAVLLLVLVLFWAFFKRTLYPVVQPGVIAYANVKTSFSIFPEFVHTYVTSHKKLIQQQKNLEIEVERLENQLAEKKGIIKELGLYITSSTTEEKVTPPLVLYPLLQDKLKLYSTILLSKGFADGVEVGDLVFVRGKQVVCTIKEVYTSSSLCLLYASSNVVTEGVTSLSSITLSLSGRGGYYIANVVRDTPITIGEKIYLRSDPSMILGEVVEVSNNNQDTSWHVFVRSAYNPVTTSIFYVQQ